MSRVALIGLLIGLAQSAAAQTLLPSMDESSFDKILADVNIDDITDSPDMVIVRGHRPSGDAQIVAFDPITCWRGSKTDVFAIYDSTFKTDDRWALRPGACDALLAAARRRKDALGR